jgi:catechol 2,3-dioxygenase-like lactoylglutathione lyase family enzyme
VFKIAIPILGVSSSLAAEQFYVGKLGFRRAYAYRPAPEQSDPCYLGVIRDGAHIVLSSFESDGPPGARNVQIYVDDILQVRDEFRAAGVELQGDVLDQTWGNVEINLKDPDGNRIVVAQDK